MIKIYLTEHHFADLVAGKIITIEGIPKGVQICLQDIGFQRMTDIVQEEYYTLIQIEKDKFKASCEESD